MDVVGHQHISVHRKAVSLAVVFNPLQIGQSVPVVTKDLLALITPYNDVIKRSFKLHSGLSRHDCYYNNITLKYRLRPDPIHYSTALGGTCTRRCWFVRKSSCRTIGACGKDSQK